MGCVRSVYYYCFSLEPGVCVFFLLDRGICGKSGDAMLESASGADEGTEKRVMTRRLNYMWHPLSCIVYEE